MDAMIALVEACEDSQIEAPGAAMCPKTASMETRAVPLSLRALWSTLRVKMYQSVQRAALSVRTTRQPDHLIRTPLCPYRGGASE